MSGIFRRPSSVAVLAAGVVACFTASVSASGVSVVVNGHPAYLSPGPIERAGRVFVPLRGIFERLGASVVYHNGTIDATRSNDTVTLRIGSTVASVNGQTSYVDVAPFIVGATTYVPLRFIAQSLGAGVGYEGATRVVSVDLARPIPPRPLPPPVSVVQLRDQNPSPGARIINRLPRISANFTHRVDPGTLRLIVNGNDLTPYTSRTATGFSFTARSPFDVGFHEVRVTGNDVSGASFDRSWSFWIVAPAPTAPPVSVVHLRNHNPAPGARINTRLPTISADFTYRVQPSTVRLSVNGNDLTPWTGRTPTGFSFAARSPFQVGSHQVRVTGTDVSGATFDRSWSFWIAAPSPTPPPTPRPTPPPQFSVTLSAPTQDQVVGQTFTVRGHTAPNARVHLDAGPLNSPVGQAFQFVPGKKVSRDLTAGPRGNFEQSLTVQPGVGLGIGVIAIATNPVSGATAQTARRVRM